MRVINKPCVWTFGKGKGKGILQVDWCKRERARERETETKGVMCTTMQFEMKKRIRSEEKEGKKEDGSQYPVKAWKGIENFNG